MTRARLLDLCAFAGYFLLAAALGRQTVVEGGQLALVWPAAGVAAAWLAVTGWRRWLVVDATVMFLCAWLVNDLTGVGSGTSLGLAVGTLGQVLVFGVLISRWCPPMWGFGEDPPPGVERLRDLGSLMIAVLVSTVAASLIGPTSIVIGGDADWTSLVTWIARNAVAVLAIFPLSLLARNAARAPEDERGLDGLGAGGVVEALLLAVATLVVLWLTFVVNDDLPIPFLLLATSVWAGTRFTAWVSYIHALLVSAFVVAATVLDEGPFQAIDDPAVQGLVVQAYIAVVVVLTLVLSVGRREGLVLNRRLELSEQASKEQATMLRTILDSMADGVTVLDRTGHLVLRNPAAAQLVGDARLDAARQLAPDPEEVVAVDGRTVAGEGGLLARVLAGEALEDLDLFVRTPGAPEGRMLEVTARPIDDTDPPLSVLVFHDVTADRRERDELASFAGVVAHDLLNPLTVVEGWSEALLESARAGVVVPPERQADQLERIQRAAQRMQHLINDLLAYTTARNLKISPVRVDLDTVAHDVARARVEASRVKGDPEPVIRVDHVLPPVLAEPVLLRQVLDNLVGNAVKYVAPGVRPQIDICAHPTTDDDGVSMVLVQVSDNGIGIPDGQHAQVFDTFHRAHQEGYRGTGLGLSIVKRIAERHGGTAWAADRPDAPGTTMSVTFPAADAP